MLHSHVLEWWLEAGNGICCSGFCVVLLLPSVLLNLAVAIYIVSERMSNIGCESAGFNTEAP